MAALVLVSIGGGEYLASLVNTMLWDQIVALEKLQEGRLTYEYSSAVAFLVSEDYTDADRPEGCPMRHGCVINNWLFTEGASGAFCVKSPISGLLIVRV